MASPEGMGPLLSTGHLASGESHKILKEIVFSRVKAYNLVQIFLFLTDTMEAYYCRKLLSVSNNRLDTYIALRFQSLNDAKVPKDSIKEIDGTNKVFHVRSTTQRDVVYTVDMVLGVCVVLREVMDHLVLNRLPLVFTVEHLPLTVFLPWYQR